MTKTIRKTFGVYEYDKEEIWLNEMAEQGWTLCGVGFLTYHFEQSEPGEYQIRMQLLEKSVNHEESRKYLSFLEDTGIEKIGHVLRWVYFRKKRTGGDFELFTDRKSIFRQMNEIIATLTIIFVMNLTMGISSISVMIRGGHPGMVVGYFNLAAAAILGWGLWKMLRKKRKLQQDDDLFE